METSPIFTPTPTPKTSSKPLLITGIVLLLIAGAAAGYFLAPKHAASTVAGASVTPDTVKNDKEEGSTNITEFGDTATGTLQAGGLGSEGTHKLIRDGGPSQTVYLTSSLVDLDEFVGKKIQVFGQTVKAAKAGWLMDVGRVKLVE